MDSEMPCFLIWSLYIHQAPGVSCGILYIFPCIVFCPFYTIPIYPLKFMIFFIYISHFIFLLLLAVTVIECDNNSLFFTSIITLT